MFRVEYAPPNHRELAREAFVADMHVHTTHSHDCNTPVRDLIKLANKLGISFAITDHNKVSGVFEALKYKNAPVIPGVEVCSKEGKEVIAYFPEASQLQEFDEQVLTHFARKHQAIRGSRTNIPMRVLLDALAQYDAVVHVPHPFAPQPRKSYHYFTRKRNKDFLGQVHSIEVFNPTLTRRANMTALGWAVHSQKGVAGGSDTHLLKGLGQGVTVSKATTVEEQLKLIKKGQVRVHGTEFKAHQKVFRFANSTVKNKFTNGMKDGLSLSKRALKS